MAAEGFRLSDVTDNRGSADRSEEEEGLAQTTVGFYDVHAQEYFDRTVSADLRPLYDRFLRHVKPGGRILDLGSGSGRDLKVMLERGYRPLGIDASSNLAALATRYSGVNCLKMSFEDLETLGHFDAVWACASLLHLPKSRISSILRGIYRSLTDGGVLFASVQVGEGEQLLADGRFFAFYGEEEFSGLLESAGFATEQLWLSKDTLSHQRQIDWLNIIARRNSPSNDAL